MSTETPAAMALDVPDGWACIALDQLVEASRGISYGVVQPGQHDADGVPIVRVNNVRNGRIDTTGVLRVSSAIESQYERTRLRGGEILLSLVGTLGECAVVPVELRGWNVARAIGVIPLESRADAKWVTYCLRSNAVQALMRAWATTTVQATLNLRDVRRLPILMAPERLRASITDAISALDDKIEQNRRTARALERLARAIFRAWFVDFEPVKAKAAGAAAFPSMPQHVFDALPTRFVDSDLGPVPDGWEVNALGDVVEMAIGGVWGEEQRTDKSTTEVTCLRGIDCHELAAGDVPAAPTRWVSGRQAAQRALPEGAILVEASGSFCGRSLWWTNRYQSFFHAPVRYSNFCKRLDPAKSASQSLVAWYQVTASYRAGELSGYRIGTAFPNLDVKAMLDTLNVVVPAEDVSAAFLELHHSAIALELRHESRKLAEMRDYLLPRLLSGSVRVEVANG